MEWQNLRPWNNSQNMAFEELCCQLARYEQVPNGSKFISKGAPDAGVECFWILPSGDEWGWQAKFFKSAPGKEQWEQIDKSIKTALKKHPKLTIYTICLPIDRQDPRLDGQKWFMDKWVEHVEKWQGWAQDKGMSVEFQYWGEHEIGERLAREEHRGRLYFWFNKETFSHQWYSDRVEEAVANAGARYTPEINVELPIAQIFDGLGRTEDFYIRIKSKYGAIRRGYDSSLYRSGEQPAKEEFNSLLESLKKIFGVLAKIEESEVDQINWNVVKEGISEAIDKVWDCSSSLDRIAVKKKKEGSKKEGAHGEKGEESYREEAFQHQQYHLRELTSELNDLDRFIVNSEVELTNKPALLLTGKAGNGKTHLFCDIARNRIQKEIPTVVLLGEQFGKEEPWAQMLKLLGLNCSREEFLGALESAAQAKGHKAVILIDALNEGEGKKLWPKHLAGMLTTLSRYPWISIAVSVRSSYEDLVIPVELLQGKLIRVEHRGLAAHEYQATRTFFGYYGIELPSIPLLIPEFQNPLFLKLFCLCLKNRGLTTMPTGIQGISAVFDFFVESVNEKLAKPEYLDLDIKEKLVQKAIAKLAAVMAKNADDWLLREEARSKVNDLLPGRKFEESLFRHMISEGILAEDRLVDENGQWEEGIHFSYERFSDHLIARHFLDEHLDNDNPAASFQPGQLLYEAIEDEQASWQNRGLIEAISIQLPERVGKELLEIAPQCGQFPPCYESFIESLIWRNRKAISEATLKCINNFVIRSGKARPLFLDALLTVSSSPDHPYNADFLHNHLISQNLPIRDSWWSVFIYQQYREHTAVDRLVDWAWSPEDKSHISDNAIRLCGISLAWFLTTSHRFLRDRATKALVALFTERIPVLRQVISTFLEVDDPYVTERLFAVAYGCAMRSDNKKEIGRLAQDVYDWIFKQGEPTPNILLRDYARGVIETALHYKAEIDIDQDKIRPPYKSDWPEAIMSEEKVKEYDRWKSDMTETERAEWRLYHNIVGGHAIGSDFARYIVGTNWGSFRWSSRRFGEPEKPTRKEIYEEFIGALTDRQNKAWGSYKRCKKIELLFDQDKRRGTEVNESNIEKAVEQTRKSEKALRTTLGKKKNKILSDSVIPYLANPHVEEDHFDLNIILRFIFQRVMDLGWTSERFGKFDEYADNFNRGREANKPERIGKKYQWIAFYEVMARVADNFHLKTSSWSSEDAKYEGPWQNGGMRDIDPSCLLAQTGADGWRSSATTWWCRSVYDRWHQEPDDATWIADASDIPDMRSILETIHPNDNSDWLTLEGHYSWTQPTPPEEDRYEIPRRKIWYIVRSYIVHKSVVDEVYEWMAKGRRLMDRRLPTSNEQIRLFLGEFFWGPAYKDLYDYDYWTEVDSETMPKPVLVTTEQYMQERGTYDCSIDDTINIYLPTKPITEGLNLAWKGEEGKFYNASDELVACDPSVREQGPGALLIRKVDFLKFLDDEGFDILWTVVGEKQTFGGDMLSRDWKGRLNISGVFRLQNGQLDGNIRTDFEP